MEFEKPEEGEWVQPVEEGYLLKCCGCGLVHRVDFRVYEGRAQFRMFLCDEPPEVRVLKMPTICYTCGKEWESKTEHECQMEGKLDELEHHLVAAQLHADFCDHFCCGLSDKACRGKALASYLRNHRTEIRRLLK